MPGNIATKRTAQYEDYEETPYVNVAPWPRVGPAFGQNLNKILDKENGKFHVPLKKDYKHKSMSYLDTEEAKPLFEWQADFIIKNNCKKILDVGCRHGPILDILYERDYMDQDFQYYGFDSSQESVEYGSTVWSEFDNVTLNVNDWELFAIPTVDTLPIDIDCAVFSGVLLYAPDKHMELFEQFTNDIFVSNYAIIQEPCPDQRHWLDEMHLQTIQEDLHLYKDKYTVVDNTITDLEVFSGRRELLGLKLTNT